MGLQFIKAVNQDFKSLFKFSKDIETHISILDDVPSDLRTVSLAIESIKDAIGIYPHASFPDVWTAI